MENVFNDENKQNEEELKEVEQQQFSPGGPTGSPGQPSGAQRGRPPTAAPPSFTPQMPGGQQLRGGPMPSGGRYNSRRPDTGIRRCLNRFTFVWLIGGGSFWFYPTYVSRNVVEGFRWRRNRWEYDRINLSRIIFHSCF